MNTKEYIKFLEKEIHTTIIATVDEKGLPVTCAIDIMYSDEKGLYFTFRSFRILRLNTRI